MIVGTCTSMCPVDEINERKHRKLVNVFEVKDNLFVKEYRRSAAGRIIHPKDVRTCVALNKTVNYLLEKVLNTTQHGYDWIAATNFMTDRLRAVRQDVIVQQLSWRQATPLLELIVRYHIFISYILHCEELYEFDSNLNQTLLNTYLSNLLEYYEIAKIETGINELHNYSEFRSYFVLLNLQNSHVIGEELKIFRTNLQMDEKISNALNIARQYHLRNHYRLFKYTNKLSFLQSCCLTHLYTKIKIEYTSLLNSAFSSKHFKFPLKKLEELLIFDGVDDLLLILELFGLKINRCDEVLQFDKNLQVDISTSQYQQCTHLQTFSRLIHTKQADLSPTEILFGKEYK